MSVLLYPEEHSSCFLYDNRQYPAVGYIEHPAGHYSQRSLVQGEIIIVTEGSFLLSFEHFFDRAIGQGEILLLSPGSKIKAKTEAGVSAFIFRLNGEERLCDNYPFECLNGEKPDFEYDLNTLRINNMTKDFLTFFQRNYRNGLRCTQFLEMKVKELLLLFRAYYPKEDLAAFFYPLLSNDSRFMNYVLQNYQGVKTVGEFAAKYGCSVSNFEKKFRFTFGVTPYQWMKERKVREIYQELNTTNKKISQIAKEQKFLSLPQFTDYCKKHFGYPPGKLRRLAGLFLYGQGEGNQKTENGDGKKKKKERK